MSPLAPQTACEKLASKRGTQKGPAAQKQNKSSEKRSVLHALSMWLNEKKGKPKEILPAEELQKQGMGYERHQDSKRI